MPVLSLTLTLMMFASGAMPMYLPSSSSPGSPQPRPAIIPATKVPWPLSARHDAFKPSMPLRTIGIRLVLAS